MNINDETQFVCCTQCKQRVSIADVLYLAEITPNIYHVAWQCDCGTRETYRSYISPVLICRMMGELCPQLPYSATPGSYSELDAESESDCAGMREEMGYVETAGDFGMLCETDDRISRNGK